MGGVVAWRLALSALGVLGVIALAVSDHRHRAVMLMVAVLVGMGALRLWTPGRPWLRREPASWMLLCT